MKNMEPHQLIKKLVEERDLALKTVESQQKQIDRLKEQIRDLMCIGCEYEKKCHDDCIQCDELLEALGEGDE